MMKHWKRIVKRSALHTFACERVDEISTMRSDSSRCFVVLSAISRCSCPDSASSYL
jgi:hypothetical protein